ncbi:hypothetical protein ES703_121737 [subsurface metagenome]
MRSVLANKQTLDIRGHQCFAQQKSEEQRQKSSNGHRLSRYRKVACRCSGSDGGEATGFYYAKHKRSRYTNGKNTELDYVRQYHCSHPTDCRVSNNNSTADQDAPKRFDAEKHVEDESHGPHLSTNNPCAKEDREEPGDDFSQLAITLFHDITCGDDVGKITHPWRNKPGNEKLFKTESPKSYDIHDTESKNLLGVTYRKSTADE